ncbi:MAG: hypothetical protein WC464_00010 [Bdellovibrionales bacterium]|jgi:hypothetical protein
MATYEQLKAKAIAAYKAGDDETADSIASMLKEAKASNAFTDVNGVLHLTATLPQKKERSIGEKIVGAGETALGVLGGGLAGAAGQVVGTAKGVGQTIASGELGTQKGAERVQREATQTAGEFAQPFMPRTEAGQEYLGAIGKEAAVLQYMNPMMAEANAIAQLAKATRPQVSVMTAPARQAAGKVAQAIPSPKIAPSLAEGADEAVKAAQGLGIDVMTSDVLRPQTFIGKSAQMASERIPLAGTGGRREAQQLQRVQAIKDVAQEFKADSALPDLESSVMADLAKTRGDEVIKYAQMKRDVFDRTSGSPMEVPNTTIAIDNQIAKLKSLKTSELDPVVASLDDFKQSIQNQDIKSVEELRKLLGEKFKSPDLVSVRGVGDKAVSDIYGALKKDMENHIVQFGDRRDVTKWGVANKKLSIMSGELENNALKYTLKKGNVTPEVISRMLYSKNVSDSQMLYKNLSPEGRSNARSAILGKAYQDSLDAEGKVSTAKFLTNIDKLDENAKVFFKGEDKAKLEGLKKALALTRRADEANLMTPTGQQLYPAAMAGAAGAAGGITGIFGLGTIGLIARAYESAPVRNALMRLSKAKTRSEQNVAMEKISEAIKQKSGKF